ncbi:VWA domain-containing protein [Biformimicrobium ophioploci]|uniref:VWFA domain-containing protein n=1 Tax=Biformimicrobium ophioploci TaxID=3036711 RepID=A0ABQ6M206_9GAMM|nr:VWA domain-containing protein [Microbulbifer sp. NKW57]GMG88317.1 hypothetical protein MNKW57_26380 [Microbulbifer sp. NKW57]
MANEWLTAFADFHFLRPAWLWLVPVTLIAGLLLAKHRFTAPALENLIDSDLLPHLMQGSDQNHRRLFYLLTAGLMTLAIILAGPTWKKLPAPVFSNQDALVILLDLSPSMRAEDLKPDRLTRARMKTLDLLNARKDGLTALVAYSGEAHVVTPLTEDTETIANLLPALAPEMMPVPGSNPEMATQVALQLLQDSGHVSGNLLFVTDDIAPEAIRDISSQVPTGVRVSAIAVATKDGAPIPVGRGGFAKEQDGSIVVARYSPQDLRKLTSAHDGVYREISIDDSDIEAVLDTMTDISEAKTSEREFDQWHESGPTILLLLLPLLAIAFRRGWLIALVAVPMLLPQPSLAQDWSSLWKNKDQQAAELLESEKPAEAAEKFQREDWRATAKYRAGEYAEAENGFADNPYNLGNTLTQQGQYDQAIESYNAALARNPDDEDAVHNRDIAQKLKELQEQQSQQSQQQGDESEQSDSDQQQDQQQDQDQSQQEDQQQEQGQSQQQDQEQDQQQGQQDQSQAQQNQQAGQQAEPDEQQSQDQSAQPQAEPEQPEQEQSPEEQKAEATRDPKDPQEQQEQAEAQPGQLDDSELDPDEQQRLEQWLREVPDDPSGLLRAKFKYESRKRRQELRTGQWQAPENGAAKRW